MNGLSERERLLRNLSDAGCDEDMIRLYLKLEGAGQRREQLRLLMRHRAALLDRLHASQAMIDCLDHLVYITRQRGNGTD